MDENSESSNGADEQAEFESESSRSSDSKDSKDEYETQKETIFVSVKNKSQAFLSGAKTIKGKVVVQ